MSRRMMCTRCFQTAEPETLLVGSDRTELLGWLCFAVPGWLYCAWRHALRQKVCAFCGSGCLIREARAARVAAPSQPVSARVRSVAGALRWPRALATPRDRLRRGGLGAVLSGGLLTLWLSAALSQTTAMPAAGQALVAGLLGWMAFETTRVVRLRAPSCAAWDERGRPLPIEWVG